MFGLFWDRKGQAHRKGRGPGVLHLLLAKKGPHLADRFVQGLCHQGRKEPEPAFIGKGQKSKILLQDLKALNYRERKASDGILESHKLEELMSRLPEGRRSIFMSFVVNGQSYSEIAENNGISVNTVKTQMKRAYAFLRKEATEDLLYLFVLAFYTTFL